MEDLGALLGTEGGRTRSTFPLVMEGDPVVGPESGVSNQARRMLELGDFDGKKKA